jgi:hypothetical protein
MEQLVIEPSFVVIDGDEVKGYGQEHVTVTCACGAVVVCEQGVEPSGTCPACGGGCIKRL